MHYDQNDDASKIEPLAQTKLPSEFAGQQLFVQGEDWHNNAMLGWTTFPWDVYSVGYKDTAEVLVAELIERKASRDAVIYPLVVLTNEQSGQSSALAALAGG
ncbi:hypothetical protein WT58_07700 [Burkholderia territorii]|uniref:hypothetical protein n=1 Tax=Burkholderia territorii TaxID=1503055 RepID=UPI0007529772|nr:hypothetical protein [Burkholderia territorii]KWH11056.1 hypothetical protein WT58_07700 [Burkholderia territorii]